MVIQAQKQKDNDHIQQELQKLSINSSKAYDQTQSKSKVEIALKQSNLSLIDSKLVNLPKYERNELGESWIHIGIGAFHRAHQALYQNILLNKKGASEWGEELKIKITLSFVDKMYVKCQAKQIFLKGICGMSLLKGDIFLRDVLAQQDNLYTLLERTPIEDNATVIGSISNFILVPDKYQEAVQKLASSNTKIVSFTVTESGYGVDQDNGQLDLRNPNIEHDLNKQNEVPQSIYGLLEDSLRIRKARNQQPFTMMSCDNIFHNGDVLKAMFLQFLSLRDMELKQWIEENGAFPNTMVDRITPAFSKEIPEILAKDYNIRDLWPVSTEPFKQWVVEDNFPLGRPQWEEVGVQMVPRSHVQKYEKLKLSMLNIFQITISFYAKNCGYTYMHEALEDILLMNLGMRIMELESQPLLDHIDDINVDIYKKTSVQRVQNSAIRDTISRVAGDSSGKITKMLFPTLVEAIKLGDVKGFRYLTFSVACWYKMLDGIDTHGNQIMIDDPLKERLMASVKRGGSDPYHMLQNKDIFAPTIRNSEQFSNLLKQYLQDIYDVGVQKALEKALLENP